MTRPIPLTKSIIMELSRLHGSPDRARAKRNRDLLPTKAELCGAQVKERILVVNDLHLCEGKDANTGQIAASEGFFGEQERQFDGFLANEWLAAQQGNEGAARNLGNFVQERTAVFNLEDAHAVRETAKCKLTLCLNGDIFDFLRVKEEKPGFCFPDGFMGSSGAVRPTPANAIVQLNIIHAGHRPFFRTLAMHLLVGGDIHYLPGNHDKPMLNPIVWGGQVKVGEKTYGGFLPLLKEELLCLGADEELIAECLSRVIMVPFAIYTDVFVGHGHNLDQHNYTQFPLEEIMRPSELHETMSSSLGDYGVKIGANGFQEIDPDLDNMRIGSGKFIWHMIKHPILALKMWWGFVQAFVKEGYAVSPEEDKRQRVEDTRSVIDRLRGFVERFNAYRKDGDKMTKEAISEGLAHAEEISAVPFYSNFKKGAGFLARLFTAIFSKQDSRCEEEVRGEVLDVLNKELHINSVVMGHTHNMEKKTYLTDRETIIEFFNTHTWQDMLGDWGRGATSLGAKSRGVGVIELGVDPAGRPFRSTELKVVKDEPVNMVDADLLEEPEHGIARSMCAVRRIVQMNRVEDVLAPPTGLNIEQVVPPVVA